MWVPGTFSTPTRKDEADRLHYKVLSTNIVHKYGADNQSAIRSLETIFLNSQTVLDCLLKYQSDIPFMGIRNYIRFNTHSSLSSLIRHDAMSFLISPWM